jgi:hypothetical protein
MKILHVLKREPSKTETEIMELHSKSYDTKIIRLYEPGVNYDSFITDVFKYDKIFCW